jgi:hypothetical protein
MGRKRQQKKKRKAGRKKPTLARQADKYDCYQRSVQEVDADVPLIKKVYRAHFPRLPRTLREDFCGTAMLACRWVEGSEENRAWGIDLDPEPLEWGRAHNVGMLSPDQAARLKLIEGDVLSIGHEKVDVTVAFNFSYFLFMERETLLEYFKCAYSALDPAGGVFLLDCYGGADAQRTSEEPREVDDDLDYVWEQHSFNPIHHNVTNFIHFEFPDGSRLDRAFRYDWRLWTIPEIRDLLKEAGFSLSEVYWEGLDRKTGEGNDIYSPREKANDDPAWISYIAGIRLPGR